jgi:HAD superfamily hydrolase (TIGR01509 family)
VAAVIFDVDGTLIDNNYLHTLAWSRACREFGIETDMAVIHRLVGMGGDQLVPALTGRDMPDLDAAHGRQMARLDDEARPFSGAGELLTTIHDRGLQLGVATSATANVAEAMLGRVVRNRSMIQVLVTSDDVKSSKPAPDLVAVVLDRGSLRPADAIFVGDTRWDVEAAGRAGVRCVGLCSGGWAECELEAAGAVAVYRDVGELLTQLDSSPIAALAGI